MARKRGGLAGIWDRNKHIIKPVASTAGFMFGGPAGAAAVNGAISGFDREGKGGVGFDVKQGAVGAAKGYAMGHLAKSFGGGWDAAGKAGTSRIAGGFGNVLPGVQDGVMAAGRWAAKDPKNLLALGQTAVGGLNAYGQAQQNNMMNQQTALRRRESDEQMRIRQLLMPYFQEYLASATGGR